MECYYKEAEVLYRRIQAQDPSKPEHFDQGLWMREKAFSRDTLIMGIAGIEAFANNVLIDFCVRTEKNLPRELLKKWEISGRIHYWRLVDKVYFLPTLCNTKFQPPEFYFKRDSNEFQLFDELVRIRNGIMHGRPARILVLDNLRPNRTHVLDDTFPQNFWPVSKIGKDFTSFNFPYAKIAHDNIMWVRDSLVDFLEKVDKKYMEEEGVKFISPLIPEGKASRKELLSNWKRYVDEDS